MTKSDLVSKSDYKPVLESHYSGDHAAAVGVFPGKEEGGFVTTVEKLWLNLLNKTPDIAHAVRVGAALEERKTLRITREAKSYFYQESEDGYYPAEHEAILLHILAGFTFAVAGRRTEAAIEARRASFYLQSQYGSVVPFDDPALRLWLGTLWLYCGDWQHARVDFRVAARLSKDYAFLKDIADREMPPERVALVLAGSGPQPFWRPELRTNVAGGLQKIDFVTRYKGERLKFDGKQGEVFPPGIPTAPWYDRHQERDHVIRQTLDGSRYMMETAGTVTAVGVAKIVSIGVSATLIALGVVGGAGILYYAILSGSKEAIEIGAYIGLAVAAVGVSAGVKVYETTDKAAGKAIEAGMSPVEYYRFVRFLPDYIHLAVPGQSMPGAMLLAESGKKRPPLYELQSPDSKTDIQIYYVPGGFYSDSPSEGPKNYSVGADIKDAGEWIWSPEEMTFDKALRFCERQKFRKGRPYGIPTESEVRSGLKSQDDKPEVLKVPDVRDHVWIKAAYSDNQSVCLHFDLNPPQSHVNSPCSARRPVLCIGR